MSTWALLAQDNFPAFMEYVFSDPQNDAPLEMQWFHEDWSRAMDTERRVIIVAPRDHGKTTQIVGRVLWELGRDPNLRIKIVCASDARAMERLFEIRQHLESNRRLRHVFPRLVPDEGAEWSKHRIIVQRTARHRDASVEAAGIGSNITGGRADILIADDVVDRKNAFWVKARDEAKRAWFSDWSNTLEPHSRVWCICTLWHKDDLNHSLLDNTEYAQLVYKVDEQFGSLWPDKWPEAELRAKRREIGSIEFNRAFRNRVTDETTSLVKEHWIGFKNLAQDEQYQAAKERLTYFTSYDTAVGIKEHNDFSACCVIAVDPQDRLVYVVDAWHAHITIKQQAAEVFKEWQLYDPFRILIEKVGQSTLDEWVLNDHPDLWGIVETTSPQVSKFHRLAAVTPLLESGRVVFNKSLDPDDPGLGWSPDRGDLVGELLDFPFGKHDDMVDAFSQALNGARRYFLDAWATGGENVLDVSVGLDGEGESQRWLL